MHGLTVYVKEKTYFSTWLSLENSEDFIDVINWVSFIA